MLRFFIIMDFLVIYIVFLVDTQIRFLRDFKRDVLVEIILYSSKKDHACGQFIHIWVK